MPDSSFEVKRRARATRPCDSPCESEWKVLGRLHTAIITVLQSQSIHRNALSYLHIGAGSSNASRRIGTTDRN